MQPDTRFLLTYSDRAGYFEKVKSFDEATKPPNKLMGLAQLSTSPSPVWVWEDDENRWCFVSWLREKTINEVKTK